MRYNAEIPRARKRLAQRMAHRNSNGTGGSKLPQTGGARLGKYAGGGKLGAYKPGTMQMLKPTKRPNGQLLP